MVNPVEEDDVGKGIGNDGHRKLLSITKINKCQFKCSAWLWTGLEDRACVCCGWSFMVGYVYEYRIIGREGVSRYGDVRSS